MTMKVFLTSFFILALTSCSINAGKPNNSPLNTPTTHITTPTAQVTTPTTTQITIPTACFQYEASDDWSAKVPRACITSQSREAIIEILVTVWLTHFISTDVPEELRLEKFTIDSIKVVDKVVDSPNLPESYKADFIAEVKYFVKPTITPSSNPQSAWVAGNSISVDDGWVYNKDYVGIINTGDFYEITIWWGDDCYTC